MGKTLDQEHLSERFPRPNYMSHSDLQEFVEPGKVWAIGVPDHFALIEPRFLACGHTHFDI